MHWIDEQDVLDDIETHIPYVPGMLENSYMIGDTNTSFSDFYYERGVKNAMKNKTYYRIFSINDSVYSSSGMNFYGMYVNLSIQDRISAAETKVWFLFYTIS